MTQLRRDPENISNHFDSLFHGIGLRGSSFTDIDSLHHDGASNRFLFMEFKRWDDEDNYVEEANAGQLRAFLGLSRQPRVIVWIVWKPVRPSGLYRLRVIPAPGIVLLTRDQLRAYYASWWGRDFPNTLEHDARNDTDWLGEGAM